MPIKYAEITIVRNLKQESWVAYFKNLIGDEDIITDKDTIIISFDDGNLSDANSKYINEQFEIGPKSYHYEFSSYPLFFKKKDKNIVFLKAPILKEVTDSMNLFSYMVKKIDSNHIFKDYKNSNTIKKEPSIYNVIYEDIGIGVIFALIKIDPNFKYLVAYDDSYFDKADIGYFVNCIFTDTFIYTDTFI
jgi:hypothetical protein